MLTTICGTAQPQPSKCCGVLAGSSHALATGGANVVVLGCRSICLTAAYSWYSANGRPHWSTAMGRALYVARAKQRCAMARLCAFGLLHQYFVDDVQKLVDIFLMVSTKASVGACGDAACVLTSRTRR
jgi:hypothetical protein